MRPTILVCLTVLAAGCACTPDSAPQASAELPDASVWQGMDRDILQAKLLSGARSFCTERPDYIFEFSPDNVIAAGQCLTALRSLEDGAMIGGQPPVAVYATYGRDAVGSPYVAAWGINTNRETTKLHLVMRGPDAALIHIIHEQVLKEKTLEYIAGYHVTAVFVPWHQLTSMGAAGSKGRRDILLQGEDPVPYPVDADVSCCAAVEDRCCGLSNFVPIIRMDFQESR